MSIGKKKIEIQRVNGTPECRHTHESPKGYAQYMAWASEMNKTHRNVKCPHCNLWASWEPRTAAPEAMGNKE